MRITNRVVEAYQDCEYKAHLLLKGEIGAQHEYEMLLHELAEDYRPRATEFMLRHCKSTSAPSIATVTLDDLRKGHPLILDCTVETGQFQFRFSALKRVEGLSSIGAYHYEPVAFHHEEKVHISPRM